MEKFARASLKQLNSQISLMFGQGLEPQGEWGYILCPAFDILCAGWQFAPGLFCLPHCQE
jgi:hypothetical protein